MDNVLPFVIAPFYKGYSHKSDLLSVLGARQSPVKYIYNIWCIISGLIFCFFGYAFICKYLNGLSVTVCVLLILYGVGCEVLSGFFPVNENKNDASLSAKIHGIGSVLGFTALLFVPLFLTIMYFAIEISIGVIALISFVCGLTTFCFFIMGEKPKFTKTILRYGGLWQRLTLVFCYIPLIFMAVMFLVA